MKSDISLEVTSGIGFDGALASRFNVLTTYVTLFLRWAFFAFFGV